MATEIELKLEISPQAAVTFLEASLNASKPTIERQRSIYFDTPDLDLLNAGLSLRIRQSKRKRIQTVKAGRGHAAGMFSRQEWERKVGDETPVIDDATPIRSCLGEKANGIAPAFEVHTERQMWNVSWEATEIELVLDRGDVVVGDRHASICEIELELKAGPPAGLFSLARKIDSIVPIRLGVLTKSERGYRLLEPVSHINKAETVFLSPDMSAAAAFQYIAQSCVRQFRLNEESLLERRDSESLHQARVALRRLRSAFSIHRSMILDRQFERMRDEFRLLTVKLGQARNLDVLLKRSKPGEARSVLEDARARAYDDIEATLASPRVRGLMLDLVEWVATGDWLTDPARSEIREQPARMFAVTTLDRLRKRVKKRGVNLPALDDNAHHEVRKDAKKLRYAAEFFTLLFDREREKRKLGRFLANLEALQDTLGELNDMATASDVLARLGLDNGSTSESLVPSQKHKTELLESSAEAHAEFVDSKKFWR